MWATFIYSINFFTFMVSTRFNILVMVNFFQICRCWFWCNIWICCSGNEFHDFTWTYKVSCTCFEIAEKRLWRNYSCNAPNKSMFKSDKIAFIKCNKHLNNLFSVTCCFDVSLHIFFSIFITYFDEVWYS